MEASLNEFKNQTPPKIPLDIDRTRRGARSTFDSNDFPMTETFKQIKSKTVEAYDSSIQVVRENPVKSLAVALVVGLATGYLLKRR